MELTAQVKDQICTVALHGKIDSSNAEEFETKINALDQSEKLILDLEDLSYISSAGLRVMLRLRKKHPDLELKNASSEVYEIFDMTGFTEMIHVTRAYRRISVEGCEVIGEGANGLVYRLDPDTVVKLYKDPDCLSDIEHERDVARKALVLGIPTAISYDVVKVGDQYASMFEMINAKSFSKLLSEEPENLDTYAKMYTDLLKQLHETVVPDGQLPDKRAVTIEQIEFLKNYLPADLYEKLLAMVKEIPFDNHMIHGDYHTKNLMLQGNEVILIDMDTLCVGHPILEFASIYNAYIGFSMFDHSITKSFLGFDHDLAEQLWRKTLKLYYGTEDEAFLQKKEMQAGVLGLARIVRRRIRRKEEAETTKKYIDLLCEMIPQVDSLI